MKKQSNIQNAAAIMTAGVISFAASAQAQVYVDLTVPGGGNPQSSATNPGDGQANAFDNTLTTRYMSASGAIPTWITYTFPGPTGVNGYMLQANAGDSARAPVSWQFYGVQGGVDVLLDARTNTTEAGWTAWTANAFKRFFFENEDTYTTYKFVFNNSQSDANFICLGQIEMYGWVAYTNQPIVTAGSVRGGIELGVSVFNGTLMDGGKADVRLYIGNSPSGLSPASLTSDIQTGVFEMKAGGLEMLKTYHWALFASNEVGVAWSATNSFAYLPMDMTLPANNTSSGVTPNGIITGIPSTGSGHLNNLLVDDFSNNSRWLAFLNTYPLPVWVQYQFTDGPRLLGGYRVTIADDKNRGPRSWRLEGSSDGVNWTLLDEQSNQTWSATYTGCTYIAPAKKMHTYFRFVFTSNNGSLDYLTLTRLELYGTSELIEEPPHISLPGSEPTGAGAVKIKGFLDEGGKADIFVAYGDAPNNLTATNFLGWCWQGSFDTGILSGFAIDTEYYCTIVATNAHGSVAIPFSFTTFGHAFVWTPTTSGAWNTLGSWTQNGAAATRVPNKSGDRVSFSAGGSRALALAQPVTTIGSFTMPTTPNADNAVFSVTNSAPGQILRFENRAETPSITVGSRNGASIRFNVPVEFTGGLAFVGTGNNRVIEFRDTLTGDGGVILNKNATLRLNPATDTVYACGFSSPAANGFLSPAENGFLQKSGPATATITGNNTFALGDPAVLGGGKLVFSGGTFTNYRTIAYALFNDGGNTFEVRDSASVVMRAPNIAANAANNQIIVSTGSTLDALATTISVGNANNAINNSLTAASGGEVTTTGSILVGGASGTSGNRLITAGGKIKAGTITIASNNGIGAVLGDYEPVPIEATGTATFQTTTYVYPAFIKGSASCGGVIFTAPSINGLANLVLDPAAKSPTAWRLVKDTTATPNTVSLFYRPPGTLFLIR